MLKKKILGLKLLIINSKTNMQNTIVCINAVYDKVIFLHIKSDGISTVLIKLFSAKPYLNVSSKPRVVLAGSLLISLINPGLI